MNILNYIFNLLEESADKKPLRKQKDETEEEFHARVKFNRLKKELIRKNIIKLGEQKRIFGPHEKGFKNNLIKIQMQEKADQAEAIKQQSEMVKRKHEIDILKATPSKPTSPNLKAASNTVSDTHSNIVDKTKATLKDIIPKQTNKKAVERMFKLSKGMEKSLKSKKGYKCSSCGFPIIRYSGRYPKHCGGCSKELIRN
ncbi:MAG: hypothetical protein H8D97_01095 [Proteobacteria bacterium]|nr:hypothetical protein [Pseudomonadota bacterium]